VRKPLAINIKVATKERGDRRDKPQTPCPLVQPEPSRVPKPTSKPATTTHIQGCDCTSGKVSPARRYNQGAAARPSKAIQRQPLSPASPLQVPDSRPEIPNTRPLNSTRIEAAKPTNAPPNQALHGVNEVQSIAIISASRGAKDSI